MNISRCTLAGPALGRQLSGLLLLGACLLCSIVHAGQLSRHEGDNEIAPGLSLKALDGTPHELQDYRGKVLLVNFWATWCPPCIAEMPSIQRLSDRLTGEAFEVLAVNVGESPFQVAKFSKLVNLRLTMLLDSDGEAFKAWGGSIYPTSFLLDGDGRIRYAAYGPLEWDGDDVIETVQELIESQQTGSE
jgi:thiol-disulfide isomerase/thioredoxin